MVGMFDVADKSDTQRTATAQAIVRVSPNTIQMVKEGKSPKGNIVDAARVSATLAVKRTPDLIPYCHTIPIDHVKVDILIKDETIEVNVKVKSVWKTGVEMEALTGASIAALTIYDMLKPVDEDLSIESIRLLEKRGGLKRFREKYDKGLKAAVLVMSDTASRDEKADKSGKFAVKKLSEYGFDVVELKIVSDDMSVIESELKRFCDELKLDLVITSGGTGVGPRDVTPEATIRVLEKEVKGVSDVLLAYGQRRTPLSMLSRGVSGVRGNTVIVNLPGSLKAVSESMDALFPGILHIYKMLGGYGH